VVRFYNKHGTAEQWIKEGKQAVAMTRLSCHRFRANEVRLWLSLIAYNLGKLWRVEDMKHTAGAPHSSSACRLGFLNALQHGRYLIRLWQPEPMHHARTVRHCAGRITKLIVSRIRANELGGRLLAGEMAANSHRLADLSVKALDGIGGVKDLSQR
jgi:hypothetical protein